MTFDGKRDGFTREDLAACAKSALMKRARGAAIQEEVIAAVRRWPDFGAEAKLAESLREKIQKDHRLTFPKA